MDLLNRTTFAMPDIPVARPHVLEAESFKRGLQAIYETLKSTQESDEEIAAFYGSIRVHRIKIVSTIVLLEGEDQNGTHAVVAGHYSSVHLVYTKLKLAPEKKRTPIGFSTEGEQQQ